MLQEQKMKSVKSSALQFDRLASLSKTVSSSNLLGNSKMIIIKHSGEEYRLSITNKDKLILTK